MVVAAVALAILTTSGNFLYASTTTMYMYIHPEIGPAKSTWTRDQGRAGKIQGCISAVEGADLMDWQVLHEETIRSIWESILGHQMYDFDNAFIREVPGWVSCSSCRIFSWREEGTTTQVPHSIQPSWVVSSPCLVLKGTNDRSTTLGHPLVTKLYTLDKTGSIWVSLLIIWLVTLVTISGSKYHSIVKREDCLHQHVLRYCGTQLCNCRMQGSLIAHLCSRAAAWAGTGCCAPKRVSNGRWSVKIAMDPERPYKYWRNRFNPKMMLNAPFSNRE